MLRLQILPLARSGVDLLFGLLRESIHAFNLGIVVLDFGGIKDVFSIGLRLPTCIHGDGGLRLPVIIYRHTKRAVVALPSLQVIISAGSGRNSSTNGGSLLVPITAELATDLFLEPKLKGLPRGRKGFGLLRVSLHSCSLMG